MSLIQADTTYRVYQLFDKATTFTVLVRQQRSHQADFSAQLTRLGEGVFTEEDWVSWMGLRKKTGCAGGIETSTYFQQEAMQSSWTMPSLHARKKKDTIKHNVEANRQPISPVVPEFCASAKRESRSGCWTPDENYHQQDHHNII